MAPPPTDDSAPPVSTWQEAAAIVRARYPVIPEGAIQHWLEIFEHGGAPGLEPDVWQLVHCAYSWARRDSSWTIRIAVLERERAEIEAYCDGLAAGARKEERSLEDLNDVERLRQFAVDLFADLALAVANEKPRAKLEKAIEDAIGAMTEWE